MLQEIASSRPHTAKQRRWFQDADMDLFFWTDAEASPQRFELTLQRRDQEFAVSWTPAAGCRAARVDDGARPGGHAGAPLLIELPGEVDPQLAAEFAQRSRNIDPAVAAFVSEALAARPEKAPEAPAIPTPGPARAAPAWLATAAALVVLALVVLALVVLLAAALK